MGQIQSRVKCTKNEPVPLMTLRIMQRDRETGRQGDRETGREGYTERGREGAREGERERGRQGDRATDIGAYRQAGRQAGGRAGSVRGRADRQTDQQTDPFHYIYLAGYNVVLCPVLGKIKDD